MNLMFPVVYVTSGASGVRLVRRVNVPAETAKEARAMVEAEEFTVLKVGLARVVDSGVPGDGLTQRQLCAVTGWGRKKVRELAERCDRTGHGRGTVLLVSGLRKLVELETVLGAGQGKRQKAKTWTRINTNFMKKLIVLAVGLFVGLVGLVAPVPAGSSAPADDPDARFKAALEKRDERIAKEFFFKGVDVGAMASFNLITSEPANGLATYQTQDDLKEAVHIYAESVVATAARRIAEAALTNHANTLVMTNCIVIGYALATNIVVRTNQMLEIPKVTNVVVQGYAIRKVEVK